MRPSRQLDRFYVVGLFALVLANVTKYIFERKLMISESISDPVIGFLYGIAIAAMLVGIRRQRKAAARSE